MAKVQDVKKTSRQDKNGQVADSQDKAPGLGTQLYENVQEVGSQAQALGARAQATLGEQYQHGRESLQELQQTIETQVRNNPLQALLVAGGIGMLLGLVWRRR